VSCALITLLCEGKSEFRISKQEMIKGIEGHGFYDELVIPIIENTAWEHELADSLGEAIKNYPGTVAVLVRHHGMYVWGKTWQQAKRHAECLHYLFDATIQTHHLGLAHLISTNGNGNGNKRSSKSDVINGKSQRVGCSPLKYKHLVFDIEGTLCPISFVKDVLFPYSSNQVKAFLESHQESFEVISVIDALKTLYKEKHEVETVNSDEVISFILQLIEKDVKVTPLKILQGLIWEDGYKEGMLVSNLFDDILPNFERFSEAGVRLSIYSSGSRKAQQLLFQYTSFGDLRKYLTCYFDTKIGPKQSGSSYTEIALTCGCDPADCLFVTDVLEEAVAAKEAGMHAIVAVRPGNKEIVDFQGFTTITSLQDISI
jgi:methylthioribulose 1-phosphate dehydratase/enolase-phosphatase E1